MKVADTLEPRRGDSRRRRTVLREASAAGSHGYGETGREIQPAFAGVEGVTPCAQDPRSGSAHPSRRLAPSSLRARPASGHSVAAVPGWHISRSERSIDLLVISTQCIMTCILSDAIRPTLTSNWS
jgi:hypothetical protein